MPPEGRAAAADRIVPLLKRIAGEAAPYTATILVVFVLQAVDAALALMVPLPAKIVLDSVLDRKPLPGVLDAVLPASVSREPGTLLWFAVLLLLGVVVIRQIQSLTSSVLLARAGKTMVLQLRSRLFRHVQRLSLTFHDVNGIAPMLYHIENDAQTLETLILEGLASQSLREIPFRVHLPNGLLHVEGVPDDHGVGHEVNALRMPS